MTINIAGFIAEITRLSDTGQTTEHAFRPALAILFDSVADDVNCINEPKAITNVGRPDLVLLRDNGKKAKITVGHVEAKDIDISIAPKTMRDGNKNQFERYTKALPNLIYTNGLDFAFYKDGALVREISIGDWVMGVQPKPEHYDALANQLRDFAAARLQTITSAETLADMMAGKAVLIKDVLFNTLREDEALTTELAGQYKAFKSQLIHDLEIGEFADIYAETIAYGMFAARLHDETLETFSRVEALNLLPKSNPFLRRLFEFVAGPNLPDGVRLTVDELAEIFQATDLQKLFVNFGNFTQRNDPFIHFYETFLAKYNPAKRKARGVWYTPEPVVNFIVRAVDDVLKSEFGIAQGLADTSKITVDWDTGQRKLNKDGSFAKSGANQIESREVHRVQILDPAAGTGTFLAEVIRQISGRIADIAPGALSKYIEDDLVPRLHGFELLMASYAMCHMKLDMMLTAMGYKPTGTNPPRLGVYLTNSLEEGDKVNQTLPFAQWLSNEAREANTVKNDVPVMCVIGNPPYSGISQNSSEWITNLLEAYKKEPGGKQKLQERKHWLNDDYVKFIRFSEHMIAKNGEGVLAFITNHGYLDNPTFRGMRWHLLNTFDKIWVLDLHGNAKKKEVSPDGSPDKNVFDIQQGVALIIAVKKKTKGKKPLATVMHGDLWGNRKAKYDALFSSKLNQTSKTELPNQEPMFPLVVRDFDRIEKYKLGFSLDEFTLQNVSGVVTMGDGFAIADSHIEMENRISHLVNEELDENELRAEFALGKNYAKWVIDNNISKIKHLGPIVPINYRLFDKKYTVFDNRILWRWRYKIMRHHVENENIGLLTSKAFRDKQFAHAFVAKGVTEAIFLSGTTGSNAMNFPLYLYPDANDPVYTEDGALDESIRVNMDPTIRASIEAAAMGVASEIEGGPHPSSLPRKRGREGFNTETRSASAEPGAKVSEKRDADALPPTFMGEGYRVGAAPDITPRYDTDGRPNEVAIFDYIYGVLHCPAYRETYKEFLKIDFPRVPYPSSPEAFRDIQAKGTALRRLHLMEDAAIGETPYPFTGDGDNGVVKPVYEGGRVAINDTQGFDKVPDVAWHFYIGGYQPAQKWLKDRKGRTLSFDDIVHYRKIIKILSETDAIMKTIEMDLGD